MVMVKVRIGVKVVDLLSVDQMSADELSWNPGVVKSPYALACRHFFSLTEVHFRE